jgi:hypothetical protein
LRVLGPRLETRPLQRLSPSWRQASSRLLSWDRLGVARWRVKRVEGRGRRVVSRCHLHLAPAHQHCRRHHDGGSAGVNGRSLGDRGRHAPGFSEQQPARSRAAVPPGPPVPAPRERCPAVSQGCPCVLRRAGLSQLTRGSLSSSGARSASSISRQPPLPRRPEPGPARGTVPVALTLRVSNPGGLAAGRAHAAGGVGTPAGRRLLAVRRRR